MRIAQPGKSPHQHARVSHYHLAVSRDIAGSGVLDEFCGSCPQALGCGQHGHRRAETAHADVFVHHYVIQSARIEGQEGRAERLAFSILELCVKAGGSITGEHGVGEEKKAFMPVMFAEPDLDTMQRVRCAFDPERLSNPTKVFPRPRLCAEKTGPYQPHPLETAGIAQLF